MVIALQSGLEGWISKLVAYSAKKTSAAFLSVFCFSQALHVGRDPLESARAEALTKTALESPEVGRTACRFRGLSQKPGAREGNNPM